MKGRRKERREKGGTCNKEDEEGWEGGAGMKGVARWGTKLCKMKGLSEELTGAGTPNQACQGTSRKTSEWAIKR